MKKLFFIIAAVTIIVGSINAQDNGVDSRTKLQFGLKAGFNHSNVYDSEGGDFKADPKYGFVTGISVAIPLGKYFGFQPEILYSQKGFKATGSIIGINYKYTRTTSFIDIPLYIQLKPSEMISFLVGPQFSYLIKQKDDLSNTTTEQDFENDNIRKSIMGIALGIDICPRNLVVGARLGWDIQNNNGDGTSTVPRYKNIWSQVTIGFRF